MTPGGGGRGAGGPGRGQKRKQKDQDKATRKLQKTEAAPAQQRPLSEEDRVQAAR